MGAFEIKHSQLPHIERSCLAYCAVYQILGDTRLGEGSIVCRPKHLNGHFTEYRLY